MNHPADHAAERALLGAALVASQAIEAAGTMLGTEDFDSDAHGAIWKAICHLHAHSHTVEIVTVANQLAADGYRGDQFTTQALATMVAETPSISNARRYAEIILAHKTRHRLILASQQIAEAAWDTLDGGEALDKARAILNRIDLPSGDTEPDATWTEFMESTDTEYRWLVPDFLERQDRLLITAGEGAGKSILCAQIGFMVAAGIHPWTQRPIEPANVAIIDLENSPRMLTRRLGAMRKAASMAGAIVEPSRLRVHARPEGLDLTKRHDRRWLIDRCLANRTDLLIIGPAYRMSSGVSERGDIGGEDQARTVTRALDEIRSTCDVTLVMETHAPHGGNYGRDLRPFGSSVWLRWPEFGIGLRKEDDDRYLVEHWRGPRDRRTWPTALQRRRQWPWTAIMPS